MPFGKLQSALWSTLALTVLGLAASRASASCGDYVMIGGRHQAAHAVPAVTAPAKPAGVDEAASQASQRSQSPARTPCGCRGLECSAPVRNWPAPVPPVRVHVERDSLLSTAAFEPANGAGERPLCAAAPALELLDSPADIFHPPRLAG